MEKSGTDLSFPQTSVFQIRLNTLKPIVQIICIGRVALVLNELNEEKEKQMLSRKVIFSAVGSSNCDKSVKVFPKPKMDYHLSSSSGSSL